MSPEIVSKYGGTSMAQPEQVASVVSAHPEQRLVVVSAIGKGPHTPDKVTDMLYDYSALVERQRHGLAGSSPLVDAKRDELVDIHDAYYSMLSEKDRANLRGATNTMLTPSPNDDEAYFASLGEIFSAQYFGRLVGGTVANSVIWFGLDGIVDRPTTRERIQKQVQGNPGRLIIPGFAGRDTLGRTCLLGRGGTDRTQVIYCAALGWDGENYSDVDGIYTANPAIVPRPRSRVLSEVSRDEVREGAHASNGILQGDTIIDLDGSNVEIVVKNTNSPDGAGTRVVACLDGPRDHAVIGVYGHNDLTQINIRDLGMAERHGYVAERLLALSRLELSFEHLPASQDSFSVTLHGKHPEAIVNKFIDLLRRESLSPNASISQHQTGVVYVVGEGLRTPEHRVAREQATERILATTSSLGLVAESVPGHDSPSIALLVDPNDVEAHIKAIHAQEIEGVRPGLI